MPRGKTAGQAASLFDFRSHVMSYLLQSFMKLKNHLPIRAEMNFRTSGCPWKMASKEFVGISH
jgi:hypothetical protein